jgi:DNA-binding phage protein
MREYQDWHEYLIERFTADWEEAIGYLGVALEEYQEDGDMPFFLLGLQNVIEARGGIPEVAKQAGIEAKLLSDMLASDKAPRLDTLSTILRVLGCRLSIQSLEGANPNVEHAVEDPVIPRRESEMTRIELAAERRDPP